MSRQLRKLLGEGSGPTAVAEGMHLHPDPILPFVQLQGAWPRWRTKVPVVAAISPGQLALAYDDQAAALTLRQDLPCAELEVKLELGRR